jgi:MFS family permease
MFARLGDRNLWAVYVATLVLGTACGLAISSVGVYLAGLGFSKSGIGALAMAFAGGVIVGAPLAGGAVRRLGGKRVLAASLGLYAAAIGAFALVPADGLWFGAARFLDGAASAGIWVSGEILLLARTRREVKGLAMSLYTLAVGLGYGLGPLLAELLLGWMPLEGTYLVAAWLSAAASLLVMLALRGTPPETLGHAAGAEEPPAVPRGPSGDSLRALMRRIRTSCFASFAYGYFQASVVLFIPIWLTDDRGIAPEDTVSITAWFAAGMLLCTNLFARLGDRVGHLLVMRALALAGSAAVFLLPFVNDFGTICGLVLVAGATFATTAPLALAALGLMVAPRDYPRANAAYNGFFALGMILGPLTSSAIFERAGGSAMFAHLGILWVAFALFTLVHRRDLPPRPASLSRARREVALA